MRLLLLFAALIFTSGRVHAQTAGSFVYTPVTCTNGATVINGVSVSVSCNNAYSTNGPNASSRVYDVYYLTVSGNSGHTGPKCIYIHAGGYVSGDKNFNWMSLTANPYGPASFVAASGCNLYIINYTLSVSTTATENPAQIQDVDCAARSLTHNSGNTTFPGDARLYVIGSSAGGQLATWIAQIGPSSNPNCEYSDTYTIYGAASSSGPMDVQQESGATYLGNYSLVLGYMEAFIGCTSALNCQASTAAYNASPVNLASANQPRMLLMAGANDTWADSVHQTLPLCATYQTLAPQKVQCQLVSGYGHMIDEQTSGLAGKVQQAEIDFIRNAPKSVATTGMTKIAGATW